VTAPAHPAKSSLAALAFGALGVVFGDIGTSVLYAVKEVFASGWISYTPAHVYGILSLLIWALTIIVSLKYVTLVLRADNQGEGGLVAMLALAASAVAHRPRLSKVLFGLGIFGAALFYGDGVITPAISVLSAVEGVALLAPSLHAAVLPATLVILLGLFLFQRRGTKGVGRAFAPIAALWFVTLAWLGLREIVANPDVLWALSPHHAWRLVREAPTQSFLLLAAVVLCVTGAEALYADMGHFGKRPIRLMWFGVVMPALVLNYLGQGALLLRQPEAIANRFFLLAPDWCAWPLVALATLATVIASQALISGAFSVTRQLIQLGYLPRMRVLHTSARDVGQVYVPFVNWTLFVVIVLAVLLFKTSSQLALAYGVAVTIDMFITTLLTFFVARYAWGHALPLAVAATGFFLLVDALFLGANLTKIVDGGWFPLVIGLTLSMLMFTWRAGRRLMEQSLSGESMALEPFVASVMLEPPTRVPGTAVFLSPSAQTVPHALLHNLKHNKVLHAQNLFVSVQQAGVPWVGLEQRTSVEPLGHACWQVTVRFGFKNEPDVPKALALVKTPGLAIDPMQTSYFLSRDTLVPGQATNMSAWREKLFVAMHRNAAAAADFLHLPHNAVIEMGTKVRL
jgi:KUP system potassium uptake protein